MRQIAATRRRDTEVTSINRLVGHVKIIVVRSVARIQTGLNWCDRSQRQTKSKQPCRSSSADEATCRGDVLQRFVASCVSAYTE